MRAFASLSAIVRGAVAGLLYLASAQAGAVPILLFDGAVAYHGASHSLDVSARLNGSSDIVPAPILAGSVMTLGAVLSAETADAFTTTGLFGGIGGVDVSIREGDGLGGQGALLLAGEIIGDLVMTGANGLDFGVVKANLLPTAGTLLPLFTNPSNLLALELNLTTVFDAGIFRSDFQDDIGGSIRAVPVPEPEVMTLMGVALIVVGVVARAGAPPGRSLAPANG